MTPAKTKLSPKSCAEIRENGNKGALSIIKKRTNEARYNERGEFLITSTPPLDETAIPATTVVFPTIVKGGGYSTQMILFGRPGTGKLYVRGQDGTLQPSSILKQ